MYILHCRTWFDTAVDEGSDCIIPVTKQVCFIVYKPN